MMIRIMTNFRIIFWAVLGLCVASTSYAEWQPDSANKGQVSASDAISRFREKYPDIEPYFEQAFGYAIIPGITRVAVGFGGAYGRGLVVSGDDLIGWTSFSQFSSGIQLGAKYFSMIVFFKDEAALKVYKTSAFQFLGQAGIDLATVGVSGTPSYSEGVAIFAVTRLGLMAEFSYSGARFKYKPLE